jgi:RNA polymerase sigma-70 factor (ECF subfamily)
MERLCRSYWKPVYTFLRLSGRQGGEDAKDLTQEFFLELVEGDLLDRYRRERGTFRSFLRGALRIFLLQRGQRAAAAKRGGGRTIVSLNEEWIASADCGLSETTLTPEEAFDREWAQSVISQALADLREDFEGSGKLVHYRLFDRCKVNPPEAGPPTYEALAQEFGIKVTDVDNYLSECRQRLRRLLVERIRECVGEEGELNDEMLLILHHHGSASS